MIAAFICLSFTNIAGAQSQNGIPVLLYHHVSEDHSDRSGLTISVAEFDRQIKLMKTAGFQTISLQEFIAYMKGSKVKLPEKPILITFDDGYADNYTNAFPILKKTEFKAAIFMVGINFDRENRLSSQNIREMIGSGLLAVGGHSMTHPDLTALANRQIQFEVAGSKAKIARLSRSPVTFFAYPGGYYNLSAMEAVEDAGYQGAFTVLTGLNNPGRDNIYLLRRIPIFSFTDFDKLLFLLNCNHSKTTLFDYDS